MMRDPSIHVNKSQFEKILDQLEVNNFPVEAFFTIARKISLNSRIVVISNKHNTNKVNKVLLANSGDTQLVADLIYATRIKLKHRGIRKISESSKEWLVCKKLADICNNYCSDFNCDNIRAGFIEFITYGAKIMGNDTRNFVNRLLSLTEKIYLYKQASIDINQYHMYSEQAKQIHDYYVSYIASNTGMTQTFYDKPLDYVYFYRVVNLIHEKFGDRYKEFCIPYIKAQFKALEYCNGIPNIQNLISDKSVENFNKYLYSNPVVEVDDDTETEGSLWDKIK